MKNISVFGTGYVGLVTGATLASLGHTVECFDISRKKIQKLKKGISPFYEPGLSELLQSVIRSGHLKFSIVNESIKLDHDFHYLAVGTPELSDGSADLNFVYSAVEFIRQKSRQEAVVIMKSTVPIGTNRRVAAILNANGVDVVSNPEFLREGTAVQDSLHPDRIIIGGANKQTLAKVRNIYKEFEEMCPIIEMSWEDAELTKYAANAFLATKISFMNEISRICDAVNADILNVKAGMVLDPRINDAFMDAGCGYGGSCFPKDVLALRHTATEHEVDTKVLGAVDLTNDIQKTHILSRYLQKHSVKGMKVTVLGLAFKPNTDDIREAPSLEIVNMLTEQHAEVKVYDPKATENFVIKMRESQTEQFSIAKTIDDALLEAEVVILCTEWQEFSNMEARLCEITSLKSVLDGRNLWNRCYFDEKEILYMGVGR